MLKIGLTGGIGSGKTAASDHFARLGAHVIDTDLLCRELVEPGQPALSEIAEAFGPELLTDDGRLDRAQMRTHIFRDPTARKRLEDILHPRIRSEMLARAERSTAPYVVFVVPLLLETGQQELVDRVLVIDVPEALQRARVAARDYVSEQQIERILQSQVDRDTRLAAADDVIRNDRDIDTLYDAVEQLHAEYLDQIQ